jgi:hypothetical protein
VVTAAGVKKSRRVQCAHLARKRRKSRTRTNDVHARVILDAWWVARPGGEAATAMECFERLAPLLPGAQGVIYDTALRGAHHQRVLRDFGWLSINRVAAAHGTTKSPRRRTPKSAHVEYKSITRPDGTKTTLRLYAQDGAIGIGELDDAGDLHFTRLRRVRTHRARAKNGKPSTETSTTPSGSDAPIGSVTNARP